LEEFEKLMNREDDWEPTRELKRIFEHRYLPKKYWNPTGKKVLEDDYKQESCCWYMFGVLCSRYKKEVERNAELEKE
jgi:hypothetical protein